MKAIVNPLLLITLLSLAIALQLRVTEPAPVTDAAEAGVVVDDGVPF
jgi:hypothetical protein